MSGCYESECVNQEIIEIRGFSSMNVNVEVKIHKCVQYSVNTGMLNCYLFCNIN